MSYKAQLLPDRGAAMDEIFPAPLDARRARMNSSKMLLLGSVTVASIAAKRFSITF